MPGNARRASAPLGTGARSPSPKGNARLTTRNLRGREVKTWLWIDSFQTDINLTYKTVQVRSKRVVQPIRLSERVLVFDVIWSVQNDGFYTRLAKTIMDHWRYNLTVNGSVPMKLLYLGANKEYAGFIEACSLSYAVTDVLKRQSFRMRTVSAPVEGSTLKRNVPYAPFRGDVGEWGPGWYTVQELREPWQWGTEKNRRDQKDPQSPLFGVGGGPLL